MVRISLIVFGLFLTFNLFGQYPRIILKQLEKADSSGQFIIADSDSNAVWSDALYITTDSLLTLYGDTIEGGINYEKIQDTIAAMLEAGLGISMTYNDADGEFLIESLALEDSIYNGTASLITKGTPLYAVGVQGNYWSVAPADASDITKLPAVVIAGEDIASGATGLGLLKGHIKQVSTVGFSDGDEVYVGVGGGYTNVKPKGESNYVQRLGTVIKGNDANGSGIINLGEVQSVSNLNAGNIFIGDTDSTITTRFYIVDSTRVNATNDSIVYYQNGVQIGADVFSANSVWTEDASYVYYDGGKNVGIGTNTPFRELHVKNSENNKTVILLENTENSPFSTAEFNLLLGSQTFNFVNYSDSAAATIDGLAVKNKGVITTSNGMDGIIYAPINGQNYFLYNSRFDHDLLYVDATNDKIGIKDTTPTATLDVTGWVNITDSLVVNDIRVTGSGGGTINGVTTDATLTGDGTSGTPLSVVDDGHNHIISNVDFLQDSLTAKANASELSNYVTIAGTETITGAKTFTSDIVVQNEETNTNAAELDLYKKNGSNTGEVQNGDNVGKINFKAESGATNSTGASIESVVTTLFGNEIGSDLIFKTASPLNSRTLTEAMRIDKLGNISLDSTLFVDATNNRVGIGTSTPQGFLSIDKEFPSASTLGFTISDPRYSGLFQFKTNASSFFLPTLEGYSGTETDDAYGINIIGSIDSSEDVSSNIGVVYIQAREYDNFPLVGGASAVENANVLSVNNFGSTLMTIAANGNVGIGTSSPAYKLDVNGDVRADTYYYDVGSSLVSSSDARLKTNIQSMNNVSDKLKSLNLIKYEWNDIMYKKLEGRTSQSKLGGTFEGMIAQQVESIFPEYVGIDKDGYKTLSYVSFIVPLLKGFQEQQAIIETQATEIEQLKSQIQLILQEIEQIKNN